MSCGNLAFKVIGQIYLRAHGTTREKVSAEFGHPISDTNDDPLGLDNLGRADDFSDFRAELKKHFFGRVPAL